MSNVYSRTVDLAGGSGGGGGGALIVATRSDNDNPAVFADFAALETYTGTGPGTADAARINVTDQNLAEETFAVGTLDGSNQVTAITAAYIRLNGEWVAVATNLVGTPGAPGEDGEDGQADLTGLTNTKIPFNNDGVLADSPIRVMPDGTAFITRIARVESGTIAVGPYVEVSERGGFLGITNAFNDQFTLVDFRTPNDTASSTPRIFELLEAENDVVRSSVNTDSLTSPVDFTIQPTLLSRVNSFMFQAGTPITGLRLRIFSQRVGDNNAVLKYWPSEADWLDGTGEDFAAGMMMIDFGDTQLPLNVNIPLGVEVRFDSGTVLGELPNDPALTIRLQRAQFTDLALLRDILNADWDETDTTSLAFIENKPTIPTLRTASETADLLETLTDDDRLDASAIRNLPADVDNFVDTVDLSVSGQDLTITLGRTGALADLTDTITLPDGGTTPTASIHGFSLNIPQSVETNTVLTTTPVVTYSAANHAQIQSLTVNIDGTAYSLTVPTRDGEHSETVTLAQAIPTSAARTVTNTLTGVNTDGGALNTLNYNLTVFVPVINPDVFYGLSDSNNPATVDVNTLTEINRIDPLTVATGTSTANDYFILLVPADEDVTSITDTVLQQDVTDIFVRTAEVRTLGPITYNSYVIGPLNAGVDEEYVVRF